MANPRGRPKDILTREQQIDRQRKRHYQRSKAQARFRDESWDLTYEQWCSIWGDLWLQRGKDRDSYNITRSDPSQGWLASNCIIKPRYDSLIEKNFLKPRRNTNETNQ